MLVLVFDGIKQSCAIKDPSCMGHGTQTHGSDESLGGRHVHSAIDLMIPTHHVHTVHDTYHTYIPIAQTSVVSMFPYTGLAPQCGKQYSLSDPIRCQILGKSVN